MKHESALQRSQQFKMAPLLKITKKKAKDFLLHKQFLLPPRSLEGKSGIETVFHNLRSVQYDPQNPCGRNIDLFFLILYK